MYLWFVLRKKDMFFVIGKVCFKISVRECVVSVGIG